LGNTPERLLLQFHQPSEIDQHQHIGRKAVGVSERHHSQLLKLLALGTETKKFAQPPIINYIDAGEERIRRTDDCNAIQNGPQRQGALTLKRVLNPSQSNPVKPGQTKNFKHYKASP
jgi:hypothetical protein